MKSKITSSASQIKVGLFLRFLINLIKGKFFQKLINWLFNLSFFKKDMLSSNRIIFFNLHFFCHGFIILFCDIKKSSFSCAIQPNFYRWWFRHIIFITFKISMSSLWFSFFSMIEIASSIEILSGFA